jgi:hypothetical protein
MSKRLMIVIAFLLPLLPLPAFFLLETGILSNELATVEQLQPQSAAQLGTLPDGSEVLIEGRLDPQNTRTLDALSIYIVENSYLDADLSQQWSASQVATPFVIALPDGIVRVINQNYVLKNPLHTIERNSLQRFAGLALGDRVTVMGTVTHDVSGAAVQAKIVAGGTRADYLAFQRSSAAAPAKIAALFALLLVLLGLGLWLVRKQTQRYTQAVI